LPGSKAGINRVSFGVQSFNDLELKSSGRMHRREDVYQAAPILRAAGIQNLSFDLIVACRIKRRAPGVIPSTNLSN